MDDGSDEFTPAKLLGVGAGLYSGSVATKVASGNINFAYGVQGAGIGVIACRCTTAIWQPKVLWLIPEAVPFVEWVDLVVAGLFAAGAAVISNSLRGLVSVFATAMLGSLGTIQMLSAYSIPHFHRFTLTSLMAGTAGCGLDETGCLAALATCVAMVWGGTLNQFKVDKMDFSLPVSFSKTANCDGIVISFNVCHTDGHCV
jgi:hypothetical protein